MPVHLFDPGCPHADPTHAGIGQTAKRCGDCPAVPRYWKVESRTPASADDLAAAMFGPTFVLDRELTQFRVDENDNCQWSCSFAVPGGTGSWLIYYGSIAPPGGGLAVSGWLAVAGGPTPFPLNEVAAYVRLDFFRCMQANVLTFIPPPTSGGFNATPDAVTITPFWP
jgi:hypothetical protein